MYRFHVLVPVPVPVPVPIKMFRSLNLALAKWWHFGKALLYTKGGADPTFASAKVKNAIGRIGIFAINFHSSKILTIQQGDSYSDREICRTCPADFC